MHRSPLVICAFILAFIGLSLTYLKATRLSLPLDPRAEATVWAVEARITFDVSARPAKVDFLLPREPAGFTILDEDFVSRGYGLIVADDVGATRQATWTVRRARGPQALYYHARVYPRYGASAHRSDTSPAFPEAPDYPEPLASAIDEVLEQTRAASADILTFTSVLLNNLNRSEDENIKLIRKAVSAELWPQLLTQVLAGARIPSRVAYGISLDNEFIDRDLQAWLEIHNGDGWYGFDPQSGRQAYPENFLVWSHGIADVLTTKGVIHPQVNFSANKIPMPQLQVADQIESKLGTGLLAFSLFDLPIHAQNVYRVMLTIPIGALVVVIMRTLIGVPTFGTFMPILVALSFRETRLLWGIILFATIVSTGLALRVALARLRLLLVPRLASVLIIVIILMLSMSLLSARLGVEQGLSIALFPIVILTMIIERMSIVWEERGPATAVKECLGSLLVAVVAFYFMTEPRLMYLLFTFPELLLVALAICLLFGGYTGYRLSEIVRFSDLAKG